MRTALAIGDAAGIGPELAAKLLVHPEMANQDVIVVGSAALFQKGARDAGAALEIPVLPSGATAADLPAGPVILDLANWDPAQITVGESSEAAGRASLTNFATALRLAGEGIADAVMFTPFNKQSMRLARPEYVDEIGFINAVLGSTRSGREFNVLDEVWNARVTSHIPLSKVASSLSVDRIFDSIALTVEVMEAAGKPGPRIGVAALNPHAGDGRNFGDEDEDIIAPAVEKAKATGFAVTGPVPSDTVFVRALKGEFDAVLTMYHDQGQIAMKLVGFDRGVTLIAGYDFPIVTPAHGTAFDIAGQGRADLGATLQAALLGRSLAQLNPRKVGSQAAQMALQSLVGEAPRTAPA
jgi:4-hydroxythreonine-4-phosphate dehydrogenase